MEVQTERLLLRPVQKEDLEELALIYAKPDVARYTSLSGRITREQSQRIVDHSVGLWERYGYGPWTALEKSRGVIIGRVGLNLLEDWPGPDKWEVGWELEPL